MKRHVEQAQRNGFFINDLSLSSGVETASLVSMVMPETLVPKDG
jgi:hypothetical protein